MAGALTRRTRLRRRAGEPVDGSRRSRSQGDAAAAAAVAAARIRLRNYFLTGIVVAAPIGITIYLTWTFVHWVDSRVKPLIPRIYNPDNYLPFSVPGVGLIFAIVILTLLGFLTANLVGRTIVSFGERLLDRVPLVRNLYRGLRQLFQTALSQTSRSFQQVALVEYPTPGVWRVAFVATRRRARSTIGWPTRT